MFIQAEREGKWALHFYVCREMLPYFFASGHWNYARDGLLYLRNMERLPNSVLKNFLNGEHVGRHKKGIWNGLWTDMIIETTYMKKGKGPGGLIGITTSPRSTIIWVI